MRLVYLDTVRDKVYAWGIRYPIPIDELDRLWKDAYELMDSIVSKTRKWICVESPWVYVDEVMGCVNQWGQRNSLNVEDISQELGDYLADALNALEFVS